MWRAASPPMGISDGSPRRNHCPKGVSNWGSARRRGATSKSPSDGGVRFSRAASARWSRLLWSARLLVPIKEIGFYKSLPFDIERPAGFEAEHVAQRLAGRGGDVDLARHAVALHPLGGVYGVAPDVVDEFVGAEHASNQRAGVEADAQLKPLADDPARGLDGLEHRERHLRNRGGLVRSRLGKTARRHGAGPRGLHPFH